MDIVQPVPAVRPTRYAMLLQAGACDRRDILARLERDAFISVLKAYGRLCDAPTKDPLRQVHLRFVHDAKARWARALSDLDMHAEGEIP